MTMEEYRMLHSELIEQYQWIEYDLEDLCAILSEEPFHKVLQEIELDSIGGVVRQIKRLEAQRRIDIFSGAEYAQLERIRERRNFWSHQCYTEAWDGKTGVPTNARLLPAELQEAKTVLKWVRQRKHTVIKQDRDQDAR